MKALHRLACVALVALAAAGNAIAQGYPSKPIRFIVPFAQGGRPGSRRGGRLGGGDGTRPPGLWHGVLRRLAIAIVAAVSLVAATSSAQNYPTKPIRFIVPFAPGGGTDIIGRIFAQQLHDELGQSVVVDNRAGAGSSLGTDIAAKAPSDGYTLLLGNISLAFNPSIYSKLPYDALTDLAPVTLVAVQPNIVVVNPALPATNVAEFAALARAKPGQIAFASAGIGSGTHLAGELLAQILKIKLLHVPYKGTGPALSDLIGGQVQMMVSTFASALPHVRNGRLRALGVTTAKRSSAAPDIPTLMEAGVPGYDYSTWYGLLVPAHTPRAIVEQLNRASRKALAREDTKRRFEEQGVDAIPGTPAEFAAYLKSETVKWTAVVRNAGITLQ